ncbi:unknown [Coraliomargarita sp. CAG:312]|nr:unknown [Coraliomargarita sp. CAG:312]
MRSLSGTISPADAKAFFSISPDIRDGLPKAKSKQMPYRGLVGEIRKTLNFWISRR